MVQKKLLTNVQLKERFKRGKVPTEESFAALIDVITNQQEKMAALVDEINRQNKMLEEKVSDASRKEFEMPVGSIIAYHGDDAPTGWLLCDGKPIPSENKYRVLRSFAGSNTPDLRSRFIVGAGQGQGLSSYPIGLGEKKGEETHKLDINEMPKHNHSGKTKNDGKHGHDRQRVAKADNDDNDGTGYYIGHRSSGHTEPNRFQDITSNGSAHSHSLKIENKGGSQAHNNLPPYYALTYIIKY